VSSFRYAVDLELACHVVGSLTAAESSLDEVVVDLRWRVARLHELWSGTAAAAHLAAHDDWETSYREMHEALVAMRRALGTAAANYHAAEAANLSMWNAVR
jgi:WXG100 family type VII secretion target